MGAKNGIIIAIFKIIPVTSSPFLTINKIEIYELLSKPDLMKIQQYQFICLLCSLFLLITPVVAVTTGNMTGIQPSGQIQTQLSTPIPSLVPTFAPPSFNIQQNVGFVPIGLIIGIILIIIALGGLLWRYFHPRYVPTEENE